MSLCKGLLKKVLNGFLKGLQIKKRRVFGKVYDLGLSIDSNPLWHLFWGEGLGFEAERVSGILPLWQGQYGFGV